ncbi:MAG: hypothetical protein KF764_02830 [Labilithrix sp.]|nr:hypothetical protein [Labilithrix sp.]
MRAPHVVLVSVVPWLALACSSVPDVQYVDVEAGADGGASGASEAGASGDGGASEEGGADASVSCPDNPPPAGSGVCCGAQLCVRCSASHCSRCERASCDGDEVCCARNSFGGGNIDCRRASACN